MRRAAGAAIAVLCSIVATNAGQSAGAADATSEEMSTAVVKGTGLSVQYPVSWVVAEFPKKLGELRKYFNKYPDFAKLAGAGASFSDRELEKLSKSLGEKRLFVADINGDGDNMIVYVERLRPGDWWTDLAEFQAVGKQTATNLGLTEIVGRRDTRRQPSSLHEHRSRQQGWNFVGVHGCTEGQDHARLFRADRRLR